MDETREGAAPLERRRVRARWVAAGAVCVALGAAAVCAGTGGWPAALLAQTQPATGATASGNPDVREAPPPDFAPPPALERDAPAQPKTEPAKPSEGGDKLAWAVDYLTWFQVTGYFVSRSHGTRFADVRATPREAAEVRMHNAELVRHLKEGFSGYPVGTMIAMSTWDVAPDLTRGAAGPIFFMRKEAPGYDPDAGDWRYAMTRPDLVVLGEGKEGRVTACRACHMQLRDRDYVPAVDR